MDPVRRDCNKTRSFFGNKQGESIVREIECCQNLFNMLKHPAQSQLAMSGEALQARILSSELIITHVGRALTVSM